MRIKLEARGQHSKLMSYMSPIIAAVLTIFCGALLFWILDKPPLQTLHTFLIMPISDLYSITELLVKAGPYCASVQWAYPFVLRPMSGILALRVSC
jgi:simple sugar transport system permease protein